MDLTFASGEWALAFHGQPLGFHFDRAVPQLFLILTLLCFCFSFPLHELVLDTDHASSWLHPLHPQPMGRQAGWVFRKSNPPRVLEKQHRQTAGPAAFLCYQNKIGFSFHLSLGNQPCESLACWPNQCWKSEQVSVCFPVPSVLLQAFVTNPWGDTSTLPESLSPSLESIGHSAPSY